jgi:hypothetical protein
MAAFAPRVDEEPARNGGSDGDAPMSNYGFPWASLEVSCEGKGRGEDGEYER